MRLFTILKRSKDRPISSIFIVTMRIITSCMPLTIQRPQRFLTASSWLPTRQKRLHVLSQSPEAERLPIGGSDSITTQIFAGICGTIFLMRRTAIPITISIRILEQMSIPMGWMEKPMGWCIGSRASWGKDWCPMQTRQPVIWMLWLLQSCPNQTMVPNCMFLITVIWVSGRSILLIQIIIIWRQSSTEAQNISGLDQMESLWWVFRIITARSALCRGPEAMQERSIWDPVIIRSLIVAISMKDLRSAGRQVMNGSISLNSPNWRRTISWLTLLKKSVSRILISPTVPESSSIPVSGTIQQRSTNSMQSVTMALLSDATRAVTPLNGSAAGWIPCYGTSWNTIGKALPILTTTTNSITSIPKNTSLRRRAMVRSYPITPSVSTWTAEETANTIRRLLPGMMIITLMPD